MEKFEPLPELLPKHDTEEVSKCCWEDGANRLARCKVATNPRFVKSAVTVKWDC